LTSVRFFAALWVALFHMLRPFSALGAPLAPVIAAGYTGVSFFFVLSGFILTYSHAQEYEEGKGQAAKFWVARLARIYPVYAVSMLAAAYLYRDQFHPAFHAIAYIADLLMVQSWSMRMVLFFNLPAWSLSAEAFFYLVFPFLLMRLRPRSTGSAVAAIVGFWLLAMLVPLICLIVFPAESWREPWQATTGAGWLLLVRRLPLLALPEFLAGISLGWLQVRNPVGNRAAAWLAGTGLVALIATLAAVDHLPFIMLNNGLLTPVFGLLILGVCRPNWLSRPLSNPVLVLLGEASFAFYLIHLMLENWMTTTFHMGDGVLPVAFKIALAMVLAILLHLGVERPCRRAILQWWRARHPGQMKMVAG
jgi:peptidoglycan/LPS O-acetylase OafA/YrhL